MAAEKDFRLRRKSFCGRCVTDGFSPDRRFFNSDNHRITKDHTTAFKGELVEEVVGELRGVGRAGSWERPPALAGMLLFLKPLLGRELFEGEEALAFLIFFLTLSAKRFILYESFLCYAKED